MKKALSIFLAAILMFSFASLAFAEYTGSPSDSPVGSPSNSPIALGSIIRVVRVDKQGNEFVHTEKADIEKYVRIFTEEDYNNGDSTYMVAGEEMDENDASVIDAAFAAALNEAALKKEEKDLETNVKNQLFYVDLLEKEDTDYYRIVFDYQYEEGFKVGNCISAWANDDTAEIYGTQDYGFTVLKIKKSAAVGIFNYDESVDTYELNTAVYAIGAVVLAAAAVVVFMVAKKKNTIAE